MIKKRSNNKAIYKNYSKDAKITSVIIFINFNVLNNLVTHNTLMDLNTLTVFIALLKFSDPYMKYSKTDIITRAPSNRLILFLQ
jgi:hypothetical protein